jgi:hypothetical protein
MISPEKGLSALAFKVGQEAWRHVPRSVRLDTNPNLYELCKMLIYLPLDGRFMYPFYVLVRPFRLLTAFSPSRSSASTSPL